MKKELTDNQKKRYFEEYDKLWHSYDRVAQERIKQQSEGLITWSELGKMLVELDKSFRSDVRATRKLCETFSDTERTLGG